LPEEYEVITIEHLLDEKEYLDKKLKHVIKLNSIYETQLNQAVKDLYEISGDKYLFEKNVKQTNLKEVELTEKQISEDESIPKNVKSLYKKIALKTHPDKILHLKIPEEKKAELEEIFISARKFLEEKNYEDLVILCLNLKIKCDEDYETQKSILSKKCLKIRQEVSDIKKLASWSWGLIEEKDFKTKTNLILHVWNSLNLGILEEHVVIDYLKSVDGVPKPAQERSNRKKPTKNKGRPKKRLSKIRRES